MPCDPLTNSKTDRDTHNTNGQRRGTHGYSAGEDSGGGEEKRVKLREELVTLDASRHI